jgi:uncharacterized membrane protein YeaQ/YmgE (transglycosylase-associated protein family)
MTLADFLLLLLVAGIIGAIGQAITGYSHGGCLFSIVVGFIGAFFGPWLARALGLPMFYVLQVGTTSIPIIWAIVGAALLVAMFGVFMRSRYYSYY